MRTIAHLSDIHFGAVDTAIVEPLADTVNSLFPDVLAVSGDLTQRASAEQFIEARKFLDRLPRPQIVVPGNHDIPLYNVYRRFVQPLAKYRTYVTKDLQPFFADEEIAIVGVNTARSLTIKGGRINKEQIAWVRSRFCSLGGSVIKIIVTHHPFDLPEGSSESEIVGRSTVAMKMMAECGADIFLAGHLHKSHTGHTATRYKIPGHSAVMVQAGTAASTRSRGEFNSFNLIRIDGVKITVERFIFAPEHEVFVPAASEGFHRAGTQWQRDNI